MPLARYAALPTSNEDLLEDKETSKTGKPLAEG
jgi:hypothetical protein